jgi:hypothetical protein
MDADDVLRRGYRDLGAAAAAGAAFAAGLTQRILEDLADGARAAAALGATAQTPVDRAGGLCRALGLRRRTHVMVGQHIARADDHVASPRQILSISLLWISQARRFDAKQKRLVKTLRSCEKPSNFSVFRLSWPLQKLQFL